MTAAMNIVEHGTGTPLVLIHGFGVDHRLLLPLDPVIARAGDWRRIYLDLPWAEGTPGDGINSTEDIYALVRATLREHLGDQPFAVLGQSYGAMHARRLAHELPQVLGLATVVGAYVADHAARTVPPKIVLRDDPGLDDDPVWADYAEIAVVRTAQNLDSFRTYAMPGSAAADQTVIERIAAAYAFDEEPEDAHPPFTRPTLILTGRQDHIVGYVDAWARLEHYPRATFLALDGGGHAVDVERAPLAHAALTDWLDRVREEASRS